MNITMQKDRITSADAFSCLRIDEKSDTVGENNIPEIAMLFICNMHPIKMLSIGFNLC